MTVYHDDLTIRPITGPDELDLFNQLSYQLNEELAGDLDDGHRRPGWLWIALRGGRLAARAAWWARPGNEHPDALDILDLDDPGRPETVDIAARLLSTAMAKVVPAGTQPPYYLRFVDPDWRGSPLDLTYMEYELLKFLATNPGKVFTREILLSRVWGYEYYGGARTVDVHIRRLRAKLGEEHAALIQTVRSVGYRFGQSRWG